MPLELRRDAHAHIKLILLIRYISFKWSKIHVFESVSSLKLDKEPGNRAGAEPRRMFQTL